MPHRQASGSAHADVTPLERAGAVALGAACHGTFAVAIASMVLGLHEGLQFGFGPLGGRAAWVANAALALSFPLIHSSLLTARGGRWLDRISARRGSALRPTTYALVASLQILLVFGGWSPVGDELWRAQGAAGFASNVAFAGSWLLLAKAMADSGLGVQTGWLGWSSVVRGHTPAFPRFAPRGLFRFTRQPIYLAFACTLWTGPVFTTDRLLLATVWTAYCLVGPLHKESRILARDPDGYGRYRTLVPYWLPRLGAQRLEP